MICEKCGKEHDGNYGSGRFCSKECARAYATKHDVNKTKIVKCNCCGTEIVVNKRSSKTTWLCNKCKNNVSTTNKKSFKKCSICGTLYIKGNNCNNDFCKKHSIIQIKTLIKYFTFDKNTVGTLNVENEFNRVAEMLNHLYNDEHKSFSDIAKIFNYTGNPGNLSKIFKYLGILPRTNSEASTLTFLNGKRQIHTSLKYKHGWHTTWDNKNVYLRSSYEFTYAEMLDNQHIKYDVESIKVKYYDTQTLKYRCAIPDFYIIDSNTIVEIKSIWTLDIQNMKDKFTAYKELGYNCKCICDNIEIDIL